MGFRCVGSSRVMFRVGLGLCCMDMCDVLYYVLGLYVRIGWRLYSTC